MRLTIPTSLTGRLNDRDDDYNRLTMYEVIVEFGDEEIVRLPTDEHVKAVWLEPIQEERIINRTIAGWLRKKLV